jgi:hypothetical protein
LQETGVNIHVLLLLRKKDLFGDSF